MAGRRGGWVDADNVPFPGGASVDLKIEGIKPTWEYNVGDPLKHISITASFNPDGRDTELCWTDEVNLSVMKIDLRIDPIPDEIEASEGWYLALNDDDDNNNNNNVPDFQEGGFFDADLKVIDLEHVPLSGYNRGTVTLRALTGGSKIKVWNN